MQAAENEVATGKTTLLQTQWSVDPAVLTTGSASPYSDFSKAIGQTTPLDLAVSANGYALTAWTAGTSVYYATKSSATSDWTSPPTAVVNTASI